MALKPTIWHPDTCGCIIEQLYDDVAPAPMGQYSKHYAVCAAHQALATGADRHDAAVDECQTKNKARADILAAVPGLTDDQILFDVLSQYVGKGRAIRITLVGTITVQQRGLATAAVAKYGTGKVVVV